MCNTEIGSKFILDDFSASLFRLDIALNNARMLGNALMRPFFNNKSTNAFSCLLNARVNELGSQLSVAH
jgi:hypothetical protein